MSNLKFDLSAEEVNKPGTEGGTPGLVERNDEEEEAEEMNQPGTEGGTPG
jgi:hypothetical protein